MVDLKDEFVSGWVPANEKLISQAEQLHLTGINDNKLLVSNMLYLVDQRGNINILLYLQVAVGYVFVYDHCLSNQLPSPEQPAQHSTAQHSTAQHSTAQHLCLIALHLHYCNGLALDCTCT